MNSVLQTGGELDHDQVSRFIRDGYLIIRGLFEPALAEVVLPLVYNELSIDPTDTGTWGRGFTTLEKIISVSPVAEIHGERYHKVIDDLCGPGAWRVAHGAGYWPVSYPDFTAVPWSPPESGWHIDGILPHLRLGQIECGLIGLELYTPIDTGDGGTAIRVGSHHDTAQVLWRAGQQGLDDHELEASVSGQSADRAVVEVTGDPGDVVFLHPYTLHAVSMNTGSNLRVMGHRQVWMRGAVELRLDSCLSTLSPVERAVVEALRE